MSEPQEFRRFAEQCKRLAEGGDLAAHRDALHSMADAWLKLAVEEERIADFVREVDNLFSAPGDALSAVRRCSLEVNRSPRAH